MSDFIPFEFNRENKLRVIENLRFFSQKMKERRSIREFSDEDVDQQIIDKLVEVANSAPSGANKQPWHFCAIRSKDLKKQIRLAAEKEEFESYNGRMSQEWLDDLKKFGTDWNKPFLELAPWLVVVFKKSYDLNEEGSKSKNYYVQESVGIACGFLIAAIQMAGLVTLTHTPSPMDFLQKILDRPANEKPFLLLPIGYPEKDVLVPNIIKKDLSQTLTYY